MFSLSELDLIKNIRSLILMASLFYLFTNCKTGVKDGIIIDESHIKETVEQIIKIDSVWSGHRVGFCLFTNIDRQYIAYYNANRNMIVGQRNINEINFSLFQMPAPPRDKNAKEKSKRFSATEVGWDSHNSITMAVDKKGFIHLSGNMHVDSLTYFRSEKPNDISSLTQYFPMVGPKELKATYPKFMMTKDDELIFHYRDGGSGNGNEIYNVYNSESQTWSRMLDVPLTDGQGLMNAYQSQPELREDGWYHVYWVWRDTPDCSTNHDLSYMKSPDLKNWYDAFDQPIALPATLDKKSLIVAPVPPKGGIINLAAKLCFDRHKKPLFVYHKYDNNGNLQLYVAQANGQKWESHLITDWDYRWEFSGNGSIKNEFQIKSFKRRLDNRFEVGYWHIKYGDGTILLDDELNPIGKVLKFEKLFSRRFNDSSLNVEGNFPGLQIIAVKDIGHNNKSDFRYALKWETLSTNRDKPREKPWPSPSSLYLYKIKTNN
tara:strand:- start:2727 stop:4193 length:1467 start_codon:yes stop_codon:yes gene_type:complete